MTRGSRKRPCPMLLGRIIHAWRSSEELSQVDAALRLGVHPSVIQSIEDGREPGGYNLLVLMQALLRGSHE